MGQNDGQDQEDGFVDVVAVVAVVLLPVVAIVYYLAGLPS